MSTRALLPTVAALVLVVTATSTAQQSGVKPTIVVGRSKVATKYGIVAASQPLAAQAGVQILERGGNAVDAAIATNAVMALVEPHYNGIGGDLLAIYYEARTGKLYGLNAAGWAPAGLTPEFLRSKGITRMPGSGIHTVTVPGAVAGWDALRARFGKLPMADLLAPAIYYADDGFPVTDVIANFWASGAVKLAAEPLAAETFLPNGRAVRAGEVFKNPRLANTLRLIAEKGAAGFYEGKTAEAIVAISRQKGGAMTLADLKDYKPEWVDPISTTYRGWNVYELPPNTQGLAALMMLNIMERYPLAEYGFQSTRTMHVEIEAKKLAYADMLRYVADPHFSNVPVGPLLGKQHAIERARLIDPRRAACEVEPSKLTGITTAKGGDTIYLSVIDKDGNIVSLIQSLYSSWGSGIVAPDTGVMLHNRGALFTMEAGHPNLVAGHKRPLTTLVPAFMSKGDVKIGFGIMGGFNQAQAHAQFVSNIADFGLDVQEALEAGRFTKTSFGGCDVDVEQLVPEKTRTELAALGHEVSVIPPRSGVFGYGQAVMSDGAGVHFGGSEPRHDGEAIPEAPPVFPRPVAAAQDPFHAERGAALAQVEWVEQAYAERLGPKGVEWRARIKKEESALTETLDWFMRNAEGDQALRLTVPLAYFWTAEGRQKESRELLTKVIALPSAAAPTALRAKALYDVGLLSFRQRDQAASRAQNEESLQISRKIQDKAGIATALIGLSRCALRDLDYAGVRKYAEEAAQIRRDLGDKRGQGTAMHMLAAIARMQGQYARAVELYTFNLDINRDAGSQTNVAGEMFNLGYVRLRQGNIQEAQKLFTHSLAAYRELQDEAGIAYNLTGFGAIAVERKQPTRAARLYGAAFAILDRLGITFDPDDQLEIDHYSAKLLASISPPAFRSATDDGRSLSPERAIALALAP